MQGPWPRSSLKPLEETSGNALSSRSILFPATGRLSLPAFLRYKHLCNLFSGISLSDVHRSTQKPCAQLQWFPIAFVTNYHIFVHLKPQTTQHVRLGFPPTPHPHQHCFYGGHSDWGEMESYVVIMCISLISESSFLKKYF